LDLLDGRVIYTLNAHEGGVHSVQFSSDGEQPNQSTLLSPLTFFPLGEHFITAGKDRVVNVWRTNFLKNLKDQTFLNNSSPEQLYCTAKETSTLSKVVYNETKEKLAFNGLENDTILEESSNEDLCEASSNQELIRSLVKQVATLTTTISDLNGRMSLMEKNFYKHMTQCKMLNK